MFHTVLKICISGSKSHPGFAHYESEYEKTRGTSNDKTRMAASQVRKNRIYSQIDNYARQHRQTLEEAAFAHRAEQIKQTVSLFFIGNPMKT